MVNLRPTDENVVDIDRRVGRSARRPREAVSKRAAGERRPDLNGRTSSYVGPGGSRPTEQQSTDGERVRVGFWLSPGQLAELSIRAGVGPRDGRARGEYITGCLFGEPEVELLRRVGEIRDSDRVRFRAELEEHLTGDLERASAVWNAKGTR